MVLVESILKPVEREWGKICTNWSHLIYTEKQPRRHETRVSKRNGTPIFAFEIPVGKTAT